MKFDENIILLDFSMSDQYKNLLFNYIIKEIESLNTYVIRIEFENGSLCELKVKEEIVTLGELKVKEKHVITKIFIKTTEQKEDQMTVSHPKSHLKPKFKAIKYSIQKRIILNFKDVYLSIAKMGMVHLILNGNDLYLKWKKISIYQF